MPAIVTPCIYRTPEAMVQRGTVIPPVASGQGDPKTFFSGQMSIWVGETPESPEFDVRLRPGELSARHGMAQFVNQDGDENNDHP